MILWLILFLVILPIGLAAGGLAGNRVPWQDPPGPVARLRIYLTTNEAELRADAMRPELRAPRFPLPPAQLHTVVISAVKALGWTMTDALPAPSARPATSAGAPLPATGTAPATARGLRVAAVVTTTLFRFQDDVVIQVQPAPNGASELTARSHSRIGKGDFGANTRHLLDLLHMVHKITGT